MVEAFSMQFFADCIAAARRGDGQDARELEARAALLTRKAGFIRQR